MFAMPFEGFGEITPPPAEGSSRTCLTALTVKLIRHKECIGKGDWLLNTSLGSAKAALQGAPHVKTRERRGSSFSQLGLEPNHTGLTAQSLFFLEESCRVKRSDTQTFSNFSNYFKRVLKLQKRSSSFSK